MFLTSYVFIGIIGVGILSVTVAADNLRVEHLYTLPTKGSAGLKFFEASNSSYIISANFWDGVDQFMGAQSTMFQLEYKPSDHGDSTASLLSTSVTQEFFGRGAHGVDVFSVAASNGKSDELMMVLPYYYQCENERNKKRCRSAAVHRWNFDTKSFDPVVSIEAGGPAQSSSFQSGGSTYLIIAENFDSQLSLRKFVPIDDQGTPTFAVSKLESIKVPGVAACTSVVITKGKQSTRKDTPLDVKQVTSDKRRKQRSDLETKIEQLVATAGTTSASSQNSHNFLHSFNVVNPESETANKASPPINQEIHVIAASYHENGWDTQSIVYKFSESQEKLFKIQSIGTSGAHDVEAIMFQGKAFLVFAEDKNNQGPLISSKIFRWDRKFRQYKLIQSIPTDGAHGAKFFTISDRAVSGNSVRNNHLFVTFANFGDRSGKRYDAISEIWKFNPTALKEAVASSEDEGQQAIEPQFELVASIPTLGATDAETFSINGSDFIAFSEEGDFQSNRFYESRVYRLTLVT